MEGIRHYRQYLEGRKFTIYTDHAALRWLFTTKELKGRQARWQLLIQSYDFEIKHRAGKEMVVPDAISRLQKELYAIWKTYTYAVWSSQNNRSPRYIEQEELDESLNVRITDIDTESESPSSDYSDSISDYSDNSDETDVGCEVTGISGRDQYILELNSGQTAQEMGAVDLPHYEARRVAE